MRTLRARNSALVTYAMVAIGSMIPVLGHVINHDMLVPVRLWMCVFSVAVAASAVLLFVRRPTVPLLSAITIIVLGFTLYTDTIANLQLAHYIWRFEPFIGTRLIAFAVAITAISPTWLGYSIVAAAGLLPVFNYYVLIPPEFHQNIMRPEPWSSLLYALIAAVLYWYRNRATKIEESAIRAIEARLAADRRSQAFLAIRDLANSPLQSIELAVNLLKEQNPDASQLVAPLVRSMAKLRALTNLLARIEPGIDPSERAISFDARKILDPAQQCEPT